jgi:hypothetical protein
MGVLPIVLLIVAMKLPILGLLWFVFWAGRTPEPDGPAEEKVRGQRPRQPEPPPRLGPRRRGPHGGAAARPLPAPHRRRRHAPLPAASRTRAQST